MARFVLQVSGHAEVQTTATFPVGSRWTFNFFVYQGQALDYGQSEDIYKELAALQFSKVDGQVVEQCGSGASIDDYSVWDLADSRYVSGVLVAGATTATIDISGTTENRPVSLSLLLQQAVAKLGIKDGEDEVVVYFNACR